MTSKKYGGMSAHAGNEFNLDEYRNALELAQDALEESVYDVERVVEAYVSTRDDRTIIPGPMRNPSFRFEGDLYSPSRLSFAVSAGNEEVSYDELRESLEDAGLGNLREDHSLSFPYTGVAIDNPTEEEMDSLRRWMDDKVDWKEDDADWFVVFRLAPQGVRTEDENKEGGDVEGSNPVDGSDLPLYHTGQCL